MLRVVDNENRKKQTVSNESKPPAAERMEYRNAVWLLEHECDGTYASFAERIGRSRQEVNRFLKPNPTYGISRRMAMRIEKGFNKPDGWLSQDHGHPAPRRGADEPLTITVHEPPAPEKPADYALRALANQIPGFAAENRAHAMRLQSMDEMATWLTIRLTKQTGVHDIEITPVRPQEERPLMRALAELAPIYRVSIKGEQMYATVERFTLPPESDPEAGATMAIDLIRNSFTDMTRLGAYEKWLTIYIFDYPENDKFVISVSNEFIMSSLLLVADEAEGLRDRKDLIAFLEKNTMDTLSK